jgi:hypothetical protein
MRLIRERFLTCSLCYLKIKHVKKTGPGNSNFFRKKLITCIDLRFQRVDPGHMFNF